MRGNGLRKFMTGTHLYCLRFDFFSMYVLPKTPLYHNVQVSCTVV